MLYRFTVVFSELESPAILTCLNQLFEHPYLCFPLKGPMVHLFKPFLLCSTLAFGTITSSATHSLACAAGCQSPFSHSGSTPPGFFHRLGGTRVFQEVRQRRHRPGAASSRAKLSQGELRMSLAVEATRCSSRSKSQTCCFLGFCRFLSDFVGFVGFCQILSDFVSIRVRQWKRSPTPNTDGLKGSR